MGPAVRRFTFRRTEPTDDEICDAVVALLKAIKEAQGPPSGIFAPHYDQAMKEAGR